jgi:hypothetical protein
MSTGQTEIALHSYTMKGGSPLQAQAVIPAFLLARCSWTIHQCQPLRVTTSLVGENKG